MSSDAIMPGAWVCDKCGYILQKNVINTKDGNIYANAESTYEICPNDMNKMRQLTWREVNKTLYDEVIKLREKLSKYEGQSIS